MHMIWHPSFAFSWVATEVGMWYLQKVSSQFTRTWALGTEDDIHQRPLEVWVCFNGEECNGLASNWQGMTAGGRQGRVACIHTLMFGFPPLWPQFPSPMGCWQLSSFTTMTSHCIPQLAMESTQEISPSSLPIWQLPCHCDCQGNLSNSIHPWCLFVEHHHHHYLQQCCWVSETPTISLTASPISSPIPKPTTPLSMPTHETKGCVRE